MAHAKRHTSIVAEVELRQAAPQVLRTYSPALWHTVSWLAIAKPKLGRVS